jgi:6,7-dimethyl-8-ribityllumazine synthase
MARVIAGRMDATGSKIAVVVSRFNGLVTERLREGALDALCRHGVRPEDVDVVLVPGAFEIPLAARRLARSRKYDALVCLGAIIRGETPHYGYIASAVAQGLKDVTLEHDLPVAFGVLTTDTVEQALDRAGAKHGNKGFEAALSAVEMLSVMRSLG